MNKFKVYHRNKPSFMDNHSTTLREFPEGFTHVATVEAEDIERVFELTNHIDSDWTLNDGVEPTVAVAIIGARSTSVGDIAVEESGARYTCESIGWTRF
jgi:hypothetical protein